MGEVGLAVGVDEGRLDAELLPLLGDGDHRVPVVVRGVVADLDLQRLAGAEARFLQERLGALSSRSIGDMVLVAPCRPARRNCRRPEA